MAAIAFVLEEIIGDLNSRYLGGLLLASVLGAFMVHGIIGRELSFLYAPRRHADLDRLCADPARGGAGRSCRGVFPEGLHGPARVLQTDAPRAPLGPAGCRGAHPPGPSAWRSSSGRGASGSSRSATET